MNQMNQMNQMLQMLQMNQMNQMNKAQIKITNKNQDLIFKQQTLGSISYQFQLMTTSHLSLKPLQISHESKHETHKLASLETSLADLTKQFINKDIDTIEAETSKIQNFAKGISSIVQKLKSYKTDCTHTISELQNEVSDLEGKIQIYEREFKNNNRENQFKKQIEVNQKKYLAEWEKRIQIAQKINTEALAKVDIQDRKSKANQIFKWVIVTIYGQPQTKFYWPNFKQQIFLRDEGQDFRVRMGKVNASNAREQQKVKTADFLNSYSEIASSKELKKVQKEIEDIRKIAQIYLNCYELAKTIRSLQTSIQKSRQQSRERDEEAMRWKAREEALQDRIKTNKQYLTVLNRIESLLANKIQSYTEKQNSANQIIRALKQDGTIGPISINVGSEEREHCECTIF